MADIQLWADFDHDGRLTLSSAEYDARSTLPGAILVGNLDNDSRALPTDATKGSPPQLDYQKNTKSGKDDELMAVMIQVNNAAALTGLTFGLRIPAALVGKVKLYDDKGNLVAASQTATNEFPVTLAAGKTNFQLEYATFPGSPFNANTDLTTTFTAGQNADAMSLTLELFSSAASVDKGFVSLAPVLFLDNGVTASRIYMCDTLNTLASITDVRDAVKATGGVTLVPVSLDVSGGDSWLQDQFQPGVAVGADGVRQVIVHLPRLISDVEGGVASSNLSDFVTSHFPAHDVCLDNDFWNRKLAFPDTTGTAQSISITDSADLIFNMDKVFEMINYMDSTIWFISSGKADSLPSTTYDTTAWWDAFGNLSQIVQDFKTQLKTLVKGAGTKDIDDNINDLQTSINKVAKNGSTPNTVDLTAGKTTFNVDKDLLTKLYAKLDQLRSTGNYGGNVESSPPTSTAKFGKIVIGNITDPKKGDYVDIDLQRFLNNQLQPVVQFDTTWLDVGHVDEVLTFVPDANGKKQTFAVLRASSGLAISILNTAVAKYKSGITDSSKSIVPSHPSGVSPRLMTDSTSPVTRLMRGKLWSQSQPNPSEPTKPEKLAAPRIYQQLATFMTGGDPMFPTADPSPTIHDIYYWISMKVERSFPADITPYELLFCETDDKDVSTNGAIEDRFLTPVGKWAETQFEGARVIPMPVLFDRVADTTVWDKSSSAVKTSAYTPDVVNLQVLNGHLIVPRPYGPRMKPQDVVDVLTTVFAGVDGGDDFKKQLTTKMFSKFKLDVPVYWINRQAKIYLYNSGGSVVRGGFDGLMTADDLAGVFADGFPALKPDAIAKKIRTDNAGNFAPDGRIREGWQKFTINEGTVDLFEAYIQAVALALGLTVHFADSWFYHTHFGGLHCGTNILRSPDMSKFPKWWA